MSKKKTRHSAKDGKFVSKEFAESNPDEVVEVTNHDHKTELAEAKELRKKGRYIVLARRWSKPDSNSYIVDLCAGIDEAKESAEKEMQERGGKYGIQVIAFRKDNNEPEIVFEIESPYKPTHTI